MDFDVTFKLGQDVLDRISGFEGKIISIQTNLYGPPAIHVQGFRRMMNSGTPVVVVFPQDALEALDDVDGLDEEDVQ